MIYILTFFLSLIADRYREERKIFYTLIVIWLFVFLCFGYMTGSDWRGYELMYNDESELEKYILKGELGFVALVKISNLLIGDFWIFNALMKMFFLYQLIRFFELFTDRKLKAVGLSFCFQTLFMLIDCPMRFMIGASFVLLSIQYLLARRWVAFSLLLVVAVSFHLSLLVVGFVLVGVFFVSPYLSKVPKSILWAILIVCIVLANHPILRTIIYSLGGKISFFADYLIWYGDERASDFTMLSLIKSLLLGTLLIAYRNKILEMANGEYIFAMIYYSFTLGYFITLIPTGFRFNIIPGYFQVIALVQLFFYSPNQGVLTLERVSKYGLFLIFTFLLAREVEAPQYSPYSNSLYYIVTEHLPYSYRYGHNYVPE